MNCGDCVERLGQYVDRELSDQEIAEVHLHMNECGDCVKRFEFHAELKRLVHRCCCQEKAPAELRERVSRIFG